MTPPREVKAPNRRLDSWKEIAAFFGRDERTVKRWEKDRNLPVHRLPGGSRARVFAFTEELERWMRAVESPSGEVPKAEEAAPASPQDNSPALPDAAADDSTQPTPAAPYSPDSQKFWFIAGTVLLLAVVAFVAIGAYRRSVKVEAQEEANGAPVHVPSPEAEQLYLQGRFYWNKRTPQDLNKAVDYFTQAIVHDPNYAQAYVGLADCYNLLREFSAMPPEEAYPRALAAARKAVELDESSAEAHASLAFVELYWNWDVAGAEREFRRAIKLNPNYAAAHHWYANFLALAGRNSEALEEIDRAQQLDPASNAIVADRGLILFDLGKSEEAITSLKELEQSQPDFYSPHRYLTYIYLSRRDYPNFIAESLRAAELAHDEAQMAVAHAAEQGFKNGGEKGLLTSTLETEEKLYRTRQISPYFVAVSYGRLNDKDKALKFLQTTYSEHDPLFLNTRNDAAFDCLHNNAEFRQLERKTGLPPIT
jgi:tetratricopeptide (TPR) repeat protein